MLQTTGKENCPGTLRFPGSGASYDRALHTTLANLTGGISPIALMLAHADWFQHLLFSPNKQLELMNKVVHQWARYIEYVPRACGDPCCNDCIEPLPQDKRFAAEAWHRWPYNAIHQGFLLSQQWWHVATTDVQGVSKHHGDVVNFVARQMLDVVSPANFPLTNPEVLHATTREGGQNIIRGLEYFWDDWSRMAKGEMPAGVDAYEVGRNLAVTKGKVVFRNQLIELIQYTPSTKSVYPEPVLITPAWIMKYYILDLSPENSLVSYLVEKGHTVFVISWKNPAPKDQFLNLADYRTLGVMAALDTVSEIVTNQKIHTVGYCLGGTLLAIAAAAMARDGDDRLATMTLLAAQVDFTEAGELMLFIDDSQVSFLEDVMAAQGYLETRQMAGTFQLLRSNDLIWSAMVGSYLLGRRPAMFDLLAWNADGTRLPAAMHSEYLRSLFLCNDLADDRYRVDARPISLRDIRIPTFAVGTISDHVAPWQSVYKIQSLTNADVTFVLSNGGHNAGVVNPPGNDKRYHQIATHDDLDNYIDPEAWRKEAVHHKGSWWPCWEDWLATYSGDVVSAQELRRPTKKHPWLADAPGHYVLEH